MALKEDVGIGFCTWLRGLPHGSQTRIHVLCDSDADGLPAGALLVRGLRAAGYVNTAGEVRQKGESAWGAELLARIAARNPQALIVTDLGCRPEPLLGPGVPTALIDHHKPLGIPEGAVLLTAYGTGSGDGGGKDIATSGLMAYWCVEALLGSAEAAPWLWLAGISLLSDLGDKAPFNELADAKKQFGGGALRDATSLLNAPRRTANGDASAAFQLLLQAGGPKDVTSGKWPETTQLLQAKEQVAEALSAARKMPPKFTRKVRDELGADLVAIRMDTPCQVHPLVAQQWRARFPKSVIFGVNTGYRPGWVHFSGRAPSGVNLIAFLAQHRPEGADSSYGLGHDQASGGALPVPIWNEWIVREIGFGPEMVVNEEKE